jgi:hypothetical protein
LLFLCLTEQKGTDIWISDFEEYSDLGRTVLSYSSLAPASVKGNYSTELLKLKVIIVAALLVASKLFLSHKICIVPAVYYVLCKLNPCFLVA